MGTDDTWHWRCSVTESVWHETALTHLIPKTYVGNRSEEIRPLSAAVPADESWLDSSPLRGC